MDNLYYEGFTQNRELSVLRFNERILEEAADPSVPLLERLRFVSIFSSNLDEFFMVRVGALTSEYEDGSEKIDEFSGMNTEEQLESINEYAEELLKKKDEIYSHIMDELRARGINMLEYADLTPYERAYADQYFDDKVKPHLEAKLIDVNELPFIGNGIPYIIGTVYTESGDRVCLARVPEELSPMISFAASDAPENSFRYMLLETLIKERMGDIFAPFHVKEKISFILTRNGEVKIEETGDAVGDMLDAVKRRNTAEVDRVLLDREPGKLIRDYLINELNLKNKQIYVTRRVSFDFIDDFIDRIPDRLKSDLVYEKFEPFDPLSTRKEPIIEILKNEEMLLSYPYDSMEPFLNLLETASEDERVKEIRITIYRLSSNPRIAEYLMKAARNGKKVKVLIELRARFDEEHNIEWAERFKEAGCRVYFGNDDYKVHGKLCQIVLKENGEESYITHLSTGNFNEKSAKLYTDFAFMTSDRRIGEDADELFGRLIKGKTATCKHLAVAPETLYDTLIRYIRREAEKREKGWIFIKCNSINERNLMEELMLASSMGCKVMLLVRGICCILPSIEDCTDNVIICNLVGRFLEHSRVYIFGEDDDEVMYISSADLMKRNMHKRVEIACPIYSDALRREIKTVLNLNVRDNVKGRIMKSDGTLVKKNSNRKMIDSQKILMEYSCAKRNKNMV